MGPYCACLLGEPGIISATMAHSMRFRSPTISGARTRSRWRWALTQWEELERRCRHRENLRHIYQEQLESLNQFAAHNINEGAKPCLIRMPLRVENKRTFHRQMLSRGIDLGWS